MPRFERIRETVPGSLTLEYLTEKARAGWKPVVIEWIREAEGEAPEAGTATHEPPYGLRVAPDCMHLEENPVEVQALTLMMESIVQDLPFARIARELNLAGLRTRDGAPWTQQAVFNMLPRLIEAGPRILANQDWPARRRRLQPI